MMSTLENEDGTRGKEEVKKFWEKSEADFTGIVSSPEIIGLSKKYIGNEVLDVGAGYGALISQIPNAIGLDLVSKHPRVIKGGIPDMPFRDKSFDKILRLKFWNIWIIKTLNKGLDEIYRVLLDGGYLIMAVPYKEDMRQKRLYAQNVKQSSVGGGTCRFLTRNG